MSLQSNVVDGDCSGCTPGSIMGAYFGADMYGVQKNVSTAWRGWGDYGRGVVSLGLVDLSNRESKNKTTGNAYLQGRRLADLRDTCRKQTIQLRYHQSRDNVYSFRFEATKPIKLANEEGSYERKSASARVHTLRVRLTGTTVDNINLEEE